MVTGGSNFGRQAGGVVTTAYAPDTVIDYLLLRHQPRFDSYAQFFHVLQNVSTTLLQSATPAAVPLEPLKGFAGSTDSTPTAAAAPSLTLSTTTCYQYDDPSQHWHLDSFPGPGHLSSAFAADICLDAAQPGSVGHVSLVTCNAGASSQQWHFNSTSGHVASVDKFECLKPRSEGEQCHRCLDYSVSASVDMWDCKNATDAMQSNQVWSWVQVASDTASGGQNGTLRPNRASSECLTVSQAPSPAPTNNTGLELHEYSSDDGTVVAFISNFMPVENAAVQVSYRNTTLWSAAHSVLLLLVEPARDVDVGTVSVLFNTSQSGTEELRHRDYSTSKRGEVHPVSFAPSVNLDAIGGVATIDSSGFVCVGVVRFFFSHGLYSSSSSIAGSPSYVRWEFFSEIPGKALQTTNVPDAEPVPEQCNVTDNDSDYLWYNFELTATADTAANVDVEISTAGGTMCFVYADGQFVSACENSLSGTEEADHEAPATAIRFNDGPQTLQVLSVAMGMSNTGVRPDLAKGISSVKVNGQEIIGSGPRNVVRNGKAKPCGLRDSGSHAHGMNCVWCPCV